MENLEIERKFLLKSVPEELLAESRSFEIRQGYLILEQDRELRIRQIADQHWMTLKEGAGLQRTEKECRLSAEQFAFLWPLTAGRRVEKVRHLVDWQGYTLEIDVFSGPLAPLVMLEVEFGSLAESRRFSVPELVGKEVTEDRSYRIASLAVHGLPEERS